MIHICPSSDPINERSPFIAGVVDVFSAFFYKLLYTYFLFYIPFSVDAEFLFDCFFCRQSVTIPSSVSVDLISFHRLVSEDSIFHRWSDSMSEMRSPWSEWRTVIRDWLKFLWPLIKGFLENLMLFPIRVKTLDQFFLIHILQKNVKNCFRPFYIKSVRAFKSKESFFSLFLEILLFFLLISLASLYR